MIDKSSENKSTHIVNNLLSAIARKIGKNVIPDNSFLREIVQKQPAGIDQSAYERIEKLSVFLCSAKIRGDSLDKIINNLEGQGITNAAAILIAHTVVGNNISYTESENTRQQQILTITEAKNYTPEKFIEFLKKDLSKEYLSPAYLWEGYTVEQHTLNVLRQFEKYFSRRILPGNIDKNAFRIVLALHDIGIFGAVNEGKKYGIKEKEAKTKWGASFTQDIIANKMHNLGFDEKHIGVAKAIVSAYPIGQYLKDGDTESAVKTIRGMLSMVEMSPLDYFELLLVFFMLVSGSYTVDAGSPKSLDYMFVFNSRKREMNLAPDTAYKISILRQAFWSQNQLTIISA